MPEFLKFIDTYRDHLVHHAFFRTGDFEDAEDIVQDVFVKVYTQKLFPRLDNPEHYLYKMTINACRDYLRKQNTTLKMQQYYETENNRTIENEAIQSLKLKEEFFRINNMLRTLPEEQAEVVRLHIIDELNFKEIATILKKPESTIKSRFQYAIIKLKNYEK
jgi:RNA polymerase sigma-70 factor (ECF subfamily)